jgi:hypothetical protein
VNNDDVRTDLPEQMRRRRVADPQHAALVEQLRAQVAADKEASAPAVNEAVGDSKDAAALTYVPPKAPPAPKGPGVLRETYRAAVGGVRDAFTNALDTLDEGLRYTANNYFLGRVAQAVTRTQVAPSLPAGQRFTDVVPSVEKNESVPGQIGRGLTQFVVPFLTVAKGYRAAADASRAAKAGAALVAGAGVDAAAFDPHEKRLSNLINEFAPGLANPVTQYLASDPNDSRAEGRLKNALEGAGLGLAVEGLISIFRGIRGTRQAAGLKDLPPPEVMGPPNAPGGLLPAPAQMGTARNNVPVPARASSRTDPSVSATARTADENAARIQAERAAEEARVTDAFGKAGLNRDGTPVKAFEEDFGGGTPPASRNDGAGQLGDAGVPTAERVPAIDFDTARMPEPWEIDGGAAPRVEPDVEQILADTVTGNARQAYFDAADNSIVFSKDRPPGNTVISLDNKVDAALRKPAFERTADDLIALRAHAQVQDAVLEGFHRNFQIETPIRGSKDTSGLREATTPLSPAKDDSTRALSDAERASIREQGDELARRIAEADAAIKAAADEAAAAARAAKESLSAADKPITRGRGMSIGRNMESGFASPSVLANIASAMTGGMVGMNAAGEDATFEERMAAAGLGALAGLGVKVAGQKVGKTVMEGVASRKAAAEANRVAYETLARQPSVAPLRPGAKSAAEAVRKAAPAVPRAKVEEIAKAYQEGRVADLAKSLDESDFNLDRIDTEEDVKELLDATSKVFGEEISKAKGGRMTLGEIEEEARVIGASVDGLKALYGGTNQLAARLNAARLLLTASGEKADRLGRQLLDDPNPDDATRLAFHKAMMMHAAIQAQVKGVGTEVARALSAMRLQSSTLSLSIAERQALLDALGDTDAQRQVAEAFTSVFDPAVKAAIARKAASARGSDALYEAWVNGILSGTGTHALNAIGNSITGILSYAEKGMAAGIGAVRNKADRVTLGELHAQVWGTFEGIKDAIRIKGATGDVAKAMDLYRRGDYQAAQAVIDQSDLGKMWKSFFTERSYTDIESGARSMEQVPQSPAISSAGLGWDPSSLRGQIADYLGAIYRAPAGKLLAASDEFFRSATYRGELRAQAYRQAHREGLEGDAKFAKIAELLENPTKDMSDQAIRAMRDTTFSTPLGEAGQAVQTALHKSVVGKYIMPFVRTPTNILKYAGRRTPGINLASSQWRADWAAGGARRDQAVAQVAMGSLLYTMAFQLKSNGLLTGGGDIQKQAERASGVQSYAFKLGDKTYSFNRLDPVAMFLGIGGDLADISGNVSEMEMNDLTVAAMTMVKRNLYSKSYLKGLTDFLLMIEDSQRYKPETWAGRFTASFMPWSSLLNQTDRMLTDDPVVREGWTFIDSFKSRIPGLKDDLPPALNLFGEEVKMTDGWGPDWASPIRQMTANPSPLAAEIGKLNLDLRHPGRAFPTVQGAPDIDLTPKQYHRLMKIAGETFKREGEKLVGSPNYQRLPDIDDETDPKYMTARQGVIRDMWRVSLEKGRMTLLKEDKDLRRKFEIVQRNAVRAQVGLPLEPVE